MKSPTAILLFLVVTVAIVSFEFSVVEAGRNRQFCRAIQRRLSIAKRDKAKYEKKFRYGPGGNLRQYAKVKMVLAREKFSKYSRIMQTSCPGRNRRRNLRRSRSNYCRRLKKALSAVRRRLSSANRVKRNARGYRRRMVLRSISSYKIRVSRYRRVIRGRCSGKSSRRSNGKRRRGSSRSAQCTRLKMAIKRKRSNLRRMLRPIRNRSLRGFARSIAIRRYNSEIRSTNRLARSFNSKCSSKRKRRVKINRNVCRKERFALVKATGRLRRLKQVASRLRGRSRTRVARMADFQNRKRNRLLRDYRSCLSRVRRGSSSSSSRRRPRPSYRRPIRRKPKRYSSRSRTYRRRY